MTDSYARSFENYRRFFPAMVRPDLRMFQIPKTAIILDVGSGFGDDILKLKALGYSSVLGIETDPYCVEKTKDRLGVSLGSIDHTGYSQQSVEAALVDNVFHHISDYDAALSELAGILKPGGLLCFIEPRNSIWRRGMDVLTFKTPLPRLFKPVRLRREVMGEEFKTGLYPQWLCSHALFFSLLKQHFKILWLKKNPFFWLCKAQKPA